MSRAKKEAGMGLDALFMENDTGNLQARTLRLTEIMPNKNQPRRDFDDEALSTLADSIKQHGVLQPILVRPLPDGGYQIVAGERRWRAARIAGLDEMPVYIRELSDKDVKQLALVENLQREDLNPIEEALGYKKLTEEEGMTQEELAKIVGKSRSAIANSMRLLGLDQRSLDALKKGEISSGHGRALLAIEDEKEREEALLRIKREGLTVRQVEQMSKKKPEKKPEPKQTISREIEISLRETLGRVCKVNEKASGKGTITVEYYDREDLMDIAKAIGGIRK